MKYSIIIPYHSNYQLLKSCLDSLLKTIPETVEIIIVANNSNPHELDISLPERCRVLKFSRGIYYPIAVNIGVKEAKGDFIILMDADICVQAGWFEALTKCYFSHSGCGGCSAKMLDPFDGSIKEFGIGFTGYNFPHPFAGRDKEFELTREDMEVQAFCSATSLYHRDTYLFLGGMDEQLVDGYSDIALCLKLHEKGLKTFVSSKSIVYHHGSSTQGSGMSVNLRGDTKGKFMADYASLCSVDMEKYFNLAFQKMEMATQQSYYLIDFTTVADKQWHYDMLGRLGNIMWHDVYNIPAKQRNLSHIPLYTVMDDNIRRLPCPVLYFVDDFRSLKNNCIWSELRDCSRDIIIDRNANILPYTQLI